MLRKVLIGFILLKLSRGNAETDNNKNEISLLNSTKVLRIWGNSVLIVQKKNYSDLKDCDNIDDDTDNYLHNHVLRIKFSDKFYDFDLEDLMPDNKLEGRARREEFKKILLPILVALRLKSTILIPIFLVFVAIIAVKGFWAGMTALFVSKAVALKAFYNAANNRDRYHDDFDNSDDYEDYDEYHRYHDNYNDHAYHQRPHRGHNNPKGRPIVIYLNDKSKPYDRYQEDQEYDQDTWDLWKRNYLHWDRQKWEPISSFTKY